MKDHLYVKREFASLLDSEQSAYVVRSGNFLITNTATFPGIPNAGTPLKADGLLLADYYSMRDVGDDEMALYKAKQASIILKMEQNYNYIDEIANGERRLF